MRKIKAGIIGTGFIGPAHIEAVRRLGFVEMVALAEMDQATADAKAAQLGIPRAYGDWKALINDPEVEAVHICTPNTAHFPMAAEALSAGKNVFCEKPLSMNSKESAKLVEMAKKADVANAINFIYRFYPLNQEVRSKVQSGEDGRVLVIQGSYLQDWLLLRTDYNWRIEPDLGGESRAVADVGSHWCDLISYITGQKFTRVFADLAVIHKTRMKPKKAIETYSGKELTPEDYEEVPVSTEDYGTVLFEMDGGARGTFTTCQTCAGRKNRLYYEIDCENAAFAFDQEDVEHLWMGRRDGANRIIMRDPSILSPEAKACTTYPGGHPEGYPDALKNLMRSFYTYIAEGKKPSTDKPDFPTFEAGHAEIAIVEAVLESSKNKAWTQIKY